MDKTPSESWIKMENVMTAPAKPLSDLERIQQSYTSGSQTYKPTAPPAVAKPASGNCGQQNHHSDISRGR